MVNKSGESVETRDKFKQMLDHGGTMLSGGAVGVTTLASAWLLGGGPEAAAVGGAIGAGVQIALRKVGAEISTRWMSPREEIRLGAAFQIAAEEIMRRLEDGHQLRDDGFFDPKLADRSDAEEVLESVFLKVQREAEERKIPYMGYLFSSIAFDADVNAHLAHQLAKVAEQLTYRQFCILKLAAVKDKYELRDSDYRDQDDFQKDLRDILYECTELYDKQYINYKGVAYLHAGEYKDFGATIDGLTNAIPSKMTLQGIGADLYNLMKLSLIPDEDIAPIAAQLK